MNQYECVIIFTPLLGEEDLKREIAKNTKLLQDHDATIVEERNWGLKQLAYPIAAKSNGIYYIVEFKAPPTLIAKMEVEFKRNENILRFLTTSLDKHAIDYNNRRRLGLAGKGKKIIEKTTEV
jgi:small subunit ribosomal protein S6